MILLKNILILFCLGGATLCSAQKVACVGNSITYGYGLNRPDLESYPVHLDSLLGESYSVGNFGVSGKTMLRNSQDTYWSQYALTAAQNQVPDLVVISLGTNDCKTYIWPNLGSEFKSDYLAMLDLFRNVNDSVAFWIALVPPANNESWGILDSVIRSEVNPLIEEVALETGVSLIDLHSAMNGHPEWFLSDSVHPNEAGAAALAQIVYEHLTMTVPQPVLQEGRLVAPAGFSFQWYQDGLPIAEADGGKNQTLSIQNLDALYSVSVQISESSRSRYVTQPVQVDHVASLQKSLAQQQPLHKSTLTDVKGSKGTRAAKGFYVRVP